MFLEEINQEDNYDSKSYHGEGKEGLCICIFDSASLNEILVFPIIIPRIHITCRTFISPIADGNSSVVSIVSDFESVGSILIFIDFKDES